MLWRKFTSSENLWTAWTKVSGKSNTPGVDGVTLESFARNAENEISALQNQLVSRLYAPLPVRKIIFKEESEREIGILAARDRVVHQAIQQVINPLFEPHFQPCCYAYRAGSSAIKALRDIEHEIKQGKSWALKMDIDSFFDTMDHALLLSELRTEVTESLILELIEKCLKLHVFSCMSIRVNETGAVQGSVLSPLLSNIYLNPFDQAATAAGYNYYRYSDDLLFLGTTKDEVLRAKGFATKKLASLKLSCHDGKTAIRNVEEEELTFLGYAFKGGKKAVSKKAVATWQHRIEALAANMTMTHAEKQVKLDEFWTGWSSYFPREVEESLPSAHLLLLRLNRSLKTNNATERDAVRAQLLGSGGEKYSAAVHCFFAECWLQLGDWFWALLELNQAFSQEQHVDQAMQIFNQYFSPKGVTSEAIKILSGLPETLEQESILDAIEAFVEKGWIFLAQSANDFLYRYREVCCRIQEQDDVEQSDAGSGIATQEEAPVELNNAEQALFLDLFCGREGDYGREVIAAGKRFFRPVEVHFSQEALEQHLLGEFTTGIYLRRINNTVKVLVVDLDIEKKHILQCQDDPARMDERLQEAHQVAVKVKRAAEAWGLTCYIEDSGYRGRHCWFFLKQPIKVATALAFFKKLRFKVGICDRTISWEYFPGREKLSKGHLGELIKLPLGKHGKTGRRGLYLQENGVPFVDQAAFLRSIEKNDSSRLEAIAKGDIASVEAVREEPTTAVSSSGMEMQAATSEQTSLQASLREVGEPTETDQPLQRLEKRLRHFHPLVKEAPLLARQVVNNCNLVEYLVFKAVETSYLMHRDRFMLLCVFGHIGSEGRKFLHEVISHCLNYSHQITESYIRKLPAKPVSCPRLRQEYQELTAELGCDCAFPQRKGCYPSPILHALAGEQQTTEITLPYIGNQERQVTDRSVGEKERLRAINAVTQKLINLRKHQHGTLKSIAVCKAQLLAYFAEMGVDRLQMDLGTLILVKKGEETDFVIEL